MVEDNHAHQTQILKKYIYVGTVGTLLEISVPTCRHCIGTLLEIYVPICRHCIDTLLDSVPTCRQCIGTLFEISCHWQVIVLMYRHTVSNNLKISMINNRKAGGGEGGGYPIKAMPYSRLIFSF